NQAVRASAKDAVTDRNWLRESDPARFRTIGLDHTPIVLAPCSLGCSGTARHDPAPTGANRHDSPSSTPTGSALPMPLPVTRAFPPAATENRARAPHVPRRVPAGSDPVLASSRPRTRARFAGVADPC